MGLKNEDLINRVEDMIDQLQSLETDHHTNLKRSVMYYRYGMGSASLSTRYKYKIKEAPKVEDYI